MTRRLTGITWDHPRGYDSVLGASAAYAAQRRDVEIYWDRRSLQAFADRFERALQVRLERTDRDLRTLSDRLLAASPARVLERGFALVKSKGKYIRAASAVKKGERLEVTFARGQVVAEVKDRTN